jgi:hypothetical protein
MHVDRASLSGMKDEDPRTPAEKVVGRSLIDESGVGKPLSKRAMQRQRGVESYLRGEMMPRYMERAAEIEQLTRLHEQALRHAHRRLAVRHPRDPEALRRAWEEELARWDFREVNELIADHNAWYPMERDLPMDPRTGDYVLVSGRPYTREPLGPDWARAVVARADAA